MLIDTGRFLAGRQLFRDTLLSVGFGETVSGLRIVANSCSTIRRPMRRSGYTVEYECDVNLMPATGRSPVHRYRMRFGEQGDEATGIEAARLGDKPGVRWPAGILLKAWMEVPSLFMLTIATVFAIIGLTAWWRSRRP